MNIHDLEDGDDVIFKFLGDTVVEVFENEDTELHEPVEEIFNEGEEIDVTICSVYENSIGVQFGDGTVTFLSQSMVKFVRFS